MYIYVSLQLQPDPYSRLHLVPSSGVCWLGYCCPAALPSTGNRLHYVYVCNMMMWCCGERFGRAGVWSCSARVGV